jgi:hypothetical protein
MTPFEQETIAVEREKLALEHKKLDLEKGKGRETRLTIAAPVVVALLTVGFGFWTSDQQAQREYQATIFKTVADTGNADDAIDKLKFLKKVFPDGFPASIPDYPSPQDAWGPSGDFKPKETFIDEMREAGASPAQVLALWRVLLPADDWAKKKDLDAIALPGKVSK